MFQNNLLYGRGTDWEKDIKDDNYLERLPLDIRLTQNVPLLRSPIFLVQ
jgi:hypothetical protein